MFRFDFALSFSGKDRDAAISIRDALVSAGFTVFYDIDFEHEMIGINGADYLRNVYGYESRYCVVLISNNYDKSNWTGLEREAIQARELEGEHGRLLPVKLDEYTPKWFPSSRIYFDLKTRSVSDLVTLFSRTIAADQISRPSRNSNIFDIKSISLEGIWLVEEQLSRNHQRKGKIIVQQIRDEIFGVAHLTEYFMSETVEADFTVRGHLNRSELTVRLTLELNSTRGEVSPMSMEYSVDVLIGALVSDNQIVGDCLDRRGISSKLTMIKK